MPTTNEAPGDLLFAIGNSGRRDDGLGWAFADRMESMSDFSGRCEYRYQLQVEDAELVSRARSVLFVDAFRGELRSGFRWEQCEPAPAFEFTSHVLAPAAILYLSESLYGRIPPARMLLIGGSDWGLGVGLSRSASDHLENALAFYSSRCAQEAAAGRTVSEPGAGSLQAR